MSGGKFFQKRFFINNFSKVTMLITKKRLKTIKALNVLHNKNFQSV